MGRTDENGLALFHAEPGTYTVHFMKAPKGYESSAEEFTLNDDNREAIYLLAKEESESGSAADSDNAESAETDPVMDFPLAGFTFAVPEEFKHVKGDIRDADYGEIGVGSGIVIGYFRNGIIETVCKIPADEVVCGLSCNSKKTPSSVHKLNS